MTSSRGFTLIELLIATVILMSAITLTQLIFSNFVKQDNRFTAETMVYGTLLQVTQEIRFELEQGKEQGRVSRGEVSCVYKTTKTESARPTSFNLEFGTMQLGDTRFDLHNVELSCKANSLPVDVPNISHLTATKMTSGREF